MPAPASPVNRWKKPSRRSACRGSWSRPRLRAIALWLTSGCCAMTTWCSTTCRGWASSCSRSQPRGRKRSKGRGRTAAPRSAGAIPGHAVRDTQPGNRVRAVPVLHRAPEEGSLSLAGSGPGPQHHRVVNAAGLRTTRARPGGVALVRYDVIAARMRRASLGAHPGPLLFMSMSRSSASSRTVIFRRSGGSSE